ncbi:MAG: 2-amino-4-hydroxy-6-hydroxymethyldihydropteridine diphosphokinase [Stappia sp.]|uniref:2-amino-4-hydroxy-6- hydroxymethyldihydropteridine diphosphokinase n=1 Tax=Stappia sp. TaxID=1870903 RepID=UPI000C58B05C|nr:2-amino-4-hydroxy-6-hydroxymethyldihydropteridine diphosphokinase [Stappia sp.]MAA99517.1 2-amino-4-hydroxy-6-hydroxymethyldihydropteridine diphosphokinase [Stappia sp.]MBM20414.1 2-amino-4-hydroxy-6-hydroxymethyldihydropteridine diphosphokinase [Stappia sp.]
MSGGTRVRAALGLGSNLGDTSANLAEALARLSATPGIDIVARSSDYRTPPWGPVPQDDYRNACVVIETDLAPADLLARCLEVEKELGRVRDVRWGPRTIDIDLLLYGEAKVDEEGLTVPHPRMGERAFVLVPLAEIWPEAPIGDGRSVREALATCAGRDEIMLLDD